MPLVLKKKQPKDANVASVQKPPKQAKAKKPTYVRKSRFSLLIGDEGAVLVHIKGGKVLSRHFVPDATAGSLDELREILLQDKLAPLSLLVDSMDQSYVQQTLPPVSSLSVGKLIKRRMEKDFKPGDIKGHIVLGRNKTGRKDWNFLMVSVDKSQQINTWINFVLELENQFRGIFVLSVEAEVLIKDLERAMGVSKAGTGAEWKFIVSHNKVGGFRQIILKNGRLIFTRLTQPIGEPTAEVLAGSIEQEVFNTIEYMKRLSYIPTAGLDVYVIASEAVCKLVDAQKFGALHTQKLPPYDVAQLLGIEGATQPTDQFGDVILASAIGASRKNVLKLTTPESREYDKFHGIKKLQRLAATIISLGLVLYGANLAYEGANHFNSIEDFEQRKRIQQTALDKMKEEAAATKLDVDVVVDKLNIYKELKKIPNNPMEFFAVLQPLIKPEVRLKAFTWQMGADAKASGTLPPPTPPAPAPDGAPPEMITMVLTLEFPPAINHPALYQKFSEDILSPMKAQLKDFTFEFTKIPPHFLESTNLQVTFDQSIGKKEEAKPTELDLVIKGYFVKPSAEVGAP